MNAVTWVSAKTNTRSKNSSSGVTVACCWSGRILLRGACTRILWPVSTVDVNGRPAPDSRVRLPAHLLDATSDESALRRFLFGLPGVDPVGIEQRAAGLATRSIKKASKLAAIDLAISMVDLTTLEGADTPGKVRNLARKAMLPDPDRPDTPRTAAVCVYPDMVAVAEGGAGGSGVKVASVATAFPSGPVQPGGQAGRHQDGGRRGRRRDRHGDRPRRVPGRAVRHGLRPDRGGQGGLRRAPGSR